MSHTVDIEPLFRAHYRALCLYALRHVDDLALAEDIVMDCFVRLYERSAACGGASTAATAAAQPSLQPVQFTKSYLFQMVRNASVDHLRRRALEATPAAALPLEALDNVADPAADEAQEAIERSQREARLWTAIDRLPPACRNVLLLSKRDGLKNREIAQRLGISLKTVEAQLTKAYATLRGKAREIYMMLLL